MVSAAASTPSTASSAVTATVSTAVSPAAPSSSSAIEAPSTSSAAASTATATLLSGVRRHLLVVKSGNVDSLGGNLEVPSLELRPVQLDGVLDRRLRLKLKVSIALGPPRVFVANDRHPFDRSAGLEVPQQLLGGRAVVDLPHVDRAGVAVFSSSARCLGLAARSLDLRFACTSLLLFLFLEVVGFFRDPGGLGLHALDFLLEFFEVFLVVLAPLDGGRGLLGLCCCCCCALAHLVC
mmetsp:Transcript_23057/g.49096  ORF Transcript_23057/g.49096 Transcript_23057/m.49096 type:complete len:237 (+) Transcript_23057:2310-3020(+)